MRERLIGFLGLLYGIEAAASLTYVTDGTNSSPPGTVFFINTSTNEATQTVSSGSLSPAFARPLGIALSPNKKFAYVSDWDNNVVYYIDLASNTATQFVDMSISSPTGPNAIAISSNGKFAYLASYGNDTVYYIDVATNTATHLVSNTMGGFHGPAVPAISMDGTFAYVTDLNDSAVYRIDTSTNTVTAKVDGSFTVPIGVAITPDGKKAYVADSSAGAVFYIDTATNVATEISSGLFSFPYGVAISPDGKTAYIADPGAQAVFYIDTATNTITDTVEFDCDFPNWAINTVAISPDGKSLYVAGGNDSNIWHINIGAKTATLVTNTSGTPYNSPTCPATLFPLIPTSTLSGNNLKLTNYLNENAPYSVIRLLVPLHGDTLDNALEMVAPTRNAFSTFASQIAQVSMSHLLSYRTRNQRWNRQKTNPASIAAALSEGPLLADAGNRMRGGKSTPEKKDLDRSVWLGAFGVYAREKAQSQTPEFTLGSGGAILAWDYSGVYPYPIGGGIAYAHTHVHEDDQFGHANVNQGDLFVYATFPVSDFYFDTALWGGYYHTKNSRVVSFPGFNGSAHFSTHGWQFTPHLEIGYDYRSDWLGVEPFTSCDFVSCWEHKGQETGASHFNMGQKGRYCSLLRSETGVRVEEIVTYDWGQLTLMEMGSYAYQKAFHTGSIQAFLVGSPGSFTVTTLTGAQNLGVIELEALFIPNYKKSTYVSLNAHAEFGSQYQAYQGTIMFGKNF